MSSPKRALPRRIRYGDKARKGSGIWFMRGGKGQPLLKEMQQLKGVKIARERISEMQRAMNELAEFFFEYQVQKQRSLVSPEKRLAAKLWLQQFNERLPIGLHLEDYEINATLKRNGVSSTARLLLDEFQKRLETVKWAYHLSDVSNPKLDSHLEKEIKGLESQILSKREKNKAVKNSRKGKWIRYISGGRVLWRRLPLHRKIVRNVKATKRGD